MSSRIEASAAPAAASPPSVVRSETQVRWLQTALRRSGAAPDLEVNGLDDARTAAALVAYQKARSLPVTGTLDGPTSPCLLAEAKALRLPPYPQSRLPNLGDLLSAHKDSLRADRQTMAPYLATPEQNQATARLASEKKDAFQWMAVNRYADPTQKQKAADDIGAVMGMLNGRRGTSPPSARTPVTSVTPPLPPHRGFVIGPAKPARVPTSNIAAEVRRSPPSSGGGLNKLVGQVWDRRAEILSPGSTPTFRRIYNGHYRAAPADSAPLRHHPQVFLDRVGALTLDRPPGSLATVQGRAGLMTPKTLAAGGEHNAAAGRANLLFLRAGAVYQLEETRGRIYVNTAPDRAPAVLKHVVRQILDRPEAFPGVLAGKLAGPRRVAECTDNIVIYTTDSAAQGRVVAEMMRYQQKHPRDFRPEVPAMTQGRAPGISVATEPRNADGTRKLLSFGEERSKIVEQALVEATQRGLDRNGFTSLVHDKMRAAGIDPLRPH